MRTKTAACRSRSVWPPCWEQSSRLYSYWSHCSICHSSWKDPGTFYTPLMDSCMVTILNNYNIGQMAINNCIIVNDLKKSTILYQYSKCFIVILSYVLNSMWEHCIYINIVWGCHRVEWSETRLSSREAICEWLTITKVLFVGWYPLHHPLLCHTDIIMTSLHEHNDRKDVCFPSFTLYHQMRQ